MEKKSVNRHRKKGGDENALDLEFGMLKFLSAIRICLPVWLQNRLVLFLLLVVKVVPFDEFLVGNEYRSKVVHL